MATKCYIGYINQDGKLSAEYIQYDGDPKQVNPYLSTLTIDKLKQFVHSGYGADSLRNLAHKRNSQFIQCDKLSDFELH